MEAVTHTCGARLYRIEAGGVARTVHYSADGQRECHTCPQCGLTLCDADCTDAGGQAIQNAGGIAGSGDAGRPRSI